MRVTEDALAERDRLVMEHTGLVRVMAQRLAQRLPSQVEISDLISVGVLGLIDAATRYKPNTGVPFGAFARRRIQGAMLDSLRGMDWAPRSLRRLRREVDSALAEVRRRVGREPEEQEVAEHMGLSMPDYTRALEQLRTLEIGVVRSLDAAADDGTPWLELCIDPDEGVTARIERDELRQILARALQELPERERQILAMYYEEELTLAEIGEVIGVGESRVSQLRTMAISRLRSLLAAALGTAVVPRTGQRRAS